MEFFIIELLLLSSAGSVLLMILGLIDGAPDVRIPNLNRFEAGTPITDRPTAQVNAPQDLRRFDEAA